MLEMIIVLMVIGMVLALPAAISTKSWRVFCLTSFKAVMGIVLPVLTFFASTVFMPDWKGECKYGWIDCFHVGKLALSPLVLWATAALYALDIRRVQHQTQQWIVLGFFVGALVSTTCLIHGIATLGLSLSFGLWIPFYVAVWYIFRTIQLVRNFEGSALTYLWALLGSAPLWIFSVVLSKQEYLKLSDNRPECFVVSAAQKGHEIIVGPLVIIKDKGQKRRVNNQLLIFWRFEERWAMISPNTHSCFRKRYNTYGPVIARYINSPLTADIVYILLKPAEWGAVIFLRLTEE